jgi:cytochrome c oxidase subunit 3
MVSLEKRRQQRPGALGNEKFAMVLFLIAEVMLFAALVAAYIVLRLGAKVWKPENFPPLQLGLPLSSTALLCLSAAFLAAGVRSIRRDDAGGLKVYLALTLLSGLTFIGVQWAEFVRLFALGLPMNNLFGSVFYTVVGVHVVHVLGGVVLLSAVLVKAAMGRYHQYRSLGVELASYYWYFVVLVWLFLFAILYLL